MGVFVSHLKLAPAQATSPGRPNVPCSSVHKFSISSLELPDNII
jgi:hypothetical protein